MSRFTSTRASLLLTTYIAVRHGAHIYGGNVPIHTAAFLTHIAYDRSKFTDTPFNTVLHVPIRHRGVGRAVQDAFTNPHGHSSYRLYTDGA